MVVDSKFENTKFEVLSKDHNDRNREDGLRKRQVEEGK